MLEMMGAAGMIYLSEEANQTMAVLGVALNLTCYINNADLRDLEELYEAGSQKKQAESVKLLLYSFT